MEFYRSHWTTPGEPDELNDVPTLQFHFTTGGELMDRNVETTLMLWTKRGRGREFDRIVDRVVPKLSEDVPTLSEWMEKNRSDMPLFFGIGRSVVLLINMGNMCGLDEEEVLARRLIDEGRIIGNRSVPWVLC